MAVFALPNPKKDFYVDFPIQQVTQAVKSISILNPKYKYHSSNAAFNQYTFESNEFLSLGVYIDISLNAVSEGKTQINIELRRKVGTFDHSHEITNANNHLVEIVNLIAKGTTSPESVQAVIKERAYIQEFGEKSKNTALLLCLFLGVFGGHRFYTGHTLSGILQLCTFGCFGIWTLIDFVRILTGSFRDKKGNPLS